MMGGNLDGGGDECRNLDGGEMIGGNGGMVVGQSGGLSVPLEMLVPNLELLLIHVGINI